MGIFEVRLLLLVRDEMKLVLLLLLWVMVMMKLVLLLLLLLLTMQQLLTRRYAMGSGRSHVGQVVNLFGVKKQPLQARKCVKTNLRVRVARLISLT